MSVTSKAFSVVPGPPHFVPTGVLRQNIYLVSRHGKIHTRVPTILDLEPGAMQWAWFFNHIRFPPDQEFEAGEKILIVYKYWGGLPFV
jgi:hypothetical protein